MTMFLAHTRFLKGLAVLCGLCFAAIPVALSRLMNVADQRGLWIVASAIGCWMAVILLGLTCASNIRHNDFERGPGHQVLIQLLLFLLGIVLASAVRCRPRTSISDADLWL